MARRDKIHDAVKNALIKDGWEITADPYPINYKDVNLQADLGADRVIAAKRGVEKIVVEIKSFLSASGIHELQSALGQYRMYQTYLRLSGSDRILYLAFSQRAWEELFSLEAVKDLLAEEQLRLIVVDLNSEEVKLWKN